MDKILEFQGVYRWLSNTVGHHQAPIVFEGITFPSVEIAYQAQKMVDPNHKRMVAKTNWYVAKKWMNARSRGLSIPGMEIQPQMVPRSIWDQRKLDIMKCLVWQKYSQEPFKSQLLATGNAELEEGNRWKDIFWGICPVGSGIGQNHLGKLIMGIRTQLQADKYNPYGEANH